MSLSRRAGVDSQSIIKPLHSVRCPSPAWDKGVMITSCADAIAKAMDRFLREQTSGTIQPPDTQEAPGAEEDEEKEPGLKVAVAAAAPMQFHSKGLMMLQCPECGASMEPEEGCLLCRSCGYSKCS
jgi:ribonucleoside-diphosphate reductase alpha chain